MYLALGTWRCLSLSLWVLSVIHISTRQTTASISCAILPCPSVKKDWYPGFKPQVSSPPYVLSVTDQDGRSVSTYGPNVATHTISLNGTWTGNKTEKFVGFIISVYNDDSSRRQSLGEEVTGYFVIPLHQEASTKSCHFEAKTDSYRDAVIAQNSTYKEWDSFQIKWKTPTKYSSQKIIISASVVKEYGVYWDGINLSLNGAAAIPVQLTNILLLVYTVLYNFCM